MIDLSLFTQLGIDLKGKVKGQTKVLCPKCSKNRKHSKEPCLSVNIDQGVYNCKNCNWAGTVEQRIYNIPPLKNNQPTDAISDFFKKRKISMTTLLEMGITQSYEWMPMSRNGECVEGERLVMNFNYYENNLLMNVKYRDLYKTFRLFKGAKLILYNIDALENEKEAIIVEGEIDACSVHQSGFKNVVSVPNGAAGANPNFEYLDNCIGKLAHIEKFILFTDNDTTGLQLRGELIRRLGPEKCWIVKYPSGCKDANEVLIAHQEEGVSALITGAEPYPVEGISDEEELSNNIDILYENGFPEGDKIGFPRFDKLLRFDRANGFLIPSTGISHHGKSSFANEIAVRLSARYGWKWGIFSPEHPDYLHATSLMQLFIGKPIDRKDRDRMSVAHKNVAKEFLHKHFKFLDAGDTEYSIDDICEKIKEMVKKYGINGFILDPWNYLEHDFSGMSETLYVSKSLSKLKKIGKLYKVNIFVVAHPPKLEKDKDGIEKRPGLGDIAGSIHFKNKADFGFVVHKDLTNSTVSVYQEKAKFIHLGDLGVATFVRKRSTGQFFEGNKVLDHSELDLLIDKGLYPEELRVFKTPLGNLPQSELNFEDLSSELPVLVGAPALEEISKPMELPKPIEADVEGFERGKSSSAYDQDSDFPF